MAVGVREEQDPAWAPGDGFHPDCPGQVLFRHATSRWGIVLLTALFPGPRRFHRLRDLAGGISEKVLSQNLRDLVRDGLVTREVEPATPPRVTYALTPLGRRFTARLGVVLDWVGDHVPDVLEARRRYDEDQVASGPPRG
ncbi:winged helix-turn-helix transcriptional regulator [Saccharothrix sp. Mg75]|uniref:winged helix-turn-helix transcriptional regulator n=1 Tax=Saccharothrix sp. Mg75 TaxID=3445357 RepID=UPI003EEA70A0